MGLLLLSMLVMEFLTLPYNCICYNASRDVSAAGLPQNEPVQGVGRVVVLVAGTTDLSSNFFQAEFHKYHVYVDVMPMPM